MSIFTTKLRTLVSQDRVRLEEMSVNIDLTYITERVVAMSFPAAGIEAAWRNDIQDVCKLLRTKHKNNFLVFNLSERDYEYDLLDNQIVCFPFKDHHAPPLHIIFQIIFNMDSWLKANDSHVAIVHCIGGKGRTGLIIVCYLFFCGMFADVDKCLEFFALRRSAKGKGVTQPSQLRYVRYFCGIVSNKLQISVNPLILTRVSVGPVPKGYYVYVEFYPQLYAETSTAMEDGVQDKLIFSTFATPEARNMSEDGRYTTYCNVELSGDILLRGFIVGSKDKGKTNSRMFRMQFHTGLVHRGDIIVPKDQLDDLQKEKKKFQDFELRMSLESTDCPRNSIALYNMIFNQMKVTFSDQQKKLAEESNNNSPRTNGCGSGNNSPNTSVSNFNTITSPTLDGKSSEGTKDFRPPLKRSTTIVGSHKAPNAQETQRLEELLAPQPDRRSLARSESPSNIPSAPPSPYTPHSNSTAPRNIISSPSSVALGSTTITPISNTPISNTPSSHTPSVTNSPSPSPHSPLSPLSPPLTFSSSPSFSSLVSLLSRSPSVSSQSTPRAGAAREHRESQLRTSAPREPLRERSDTSKLRDAVREALRDSTQSPPPQDIWKDTTPSSWEHKRNAGSWRRASSPYPSRSNSNAPPPVHDLSQSADRVPTQSPTHTQGMTHARSESALDSATDSSSLSSSASSAGSRAASPNTTQSPSAKQDTFQHQEALRREYRKGGSHRPREDDP